jgi:hypothetical protein
MKGLKISLTIIVVAAIAFFVIRSLVGIGKPGEISLPKNQFTERVEQEIDSLGNLPDSKFCKDAYDNIKSLIDNFYKPHPPQYPYGRLGNTQIENDQRKENFTKELYSAYADKFIRQAFYVFRGSEWKNEDLQFIRSEYQTLQKSKLLERGSPVDRKFMEIQTIFSKYDEINNFISTNKSFSYSSYGLSNRFPISDVRGRIARAATYRNNRLENEHVNNCTRLHDGLKEIPQSLFRAHVRYLDNKISQWSGLYSNYNSQNDYNNNLGRPIQNEIDALTKDIYNVTNLNNVANFDSEHKRLSDKWNVDKRAAYEYKYPTNN